MFYNLYCSWYFVLSGMAAFVRNRYQNSIFAVLNPQEKFTVDQYNIEEFITLSCCGYEDSVINHIELI